MKKLNLTSEESQDLITAYKSDLRKLEFEVERVKSVLDILGKGTTEEVQEVSGTKRKRGRPKKNVTIPEAVAKPEKKKRGRKPKAKAATSAPAAKLKKAGKKEVAKKAKPVAKKKAAKKTAAKSKKVKTLKKQAKPKTPKTRKKRETKPSVWDNFIMEALKNSGKALIKSDLADMAKAHPTGFAAKMDENEINQKIGQSIHKLCNVQKLVVKTYHLGRGNAFALKQWVDKEGNLLPEFQRA